MIKIFLLSVFTIFSSVKNEPKTIVEEKIILDTPTGKIYGTLTKPTKGKKHTLALIIAGSGPTDRDGNSLAMQGKNNSLQMLSHELAANGIASVRYDKRGVNESRKAGFSEQDLRFDHYVFDAVFWLRKLKSDNRFKKIGVIGHSEGSLVGMIAATKEEIDFYISLAGAALPASEIIKKQLAGQSEKIINDSDRILARLEEGYTVDSINPMLFSIFRPSVQPYLISWFFYDPTEIVKKLNIPILVVQGTNDIQIPTENGQMLFDASNNTQLFLVKGMNHVLKITGPDMESNLAAYTNPEIPLAKGLSERITGFIKKGK